MPAQAEQAARLAAVAFRAAERLAQKHALERGEVDTFRAERGSGAGGVARLAVHVLELVWQVLEADAVAVREQHGALDDVAQLADVARPVVLAQPLHRFG